MKTYVYGFVLNMQFFSTIPMKIEVPMTHQHIERAIRTFPLLGLMQGLLYAGLFYMLMNGTSLSILAVAFLLWLSTISITGGIHLDGWIDASDAFFSFRDPKKRLAIMADPRIGAFGVLSVIILLASKLFFIYEIVALTQPTTYVLIIMIPLFGKSLMGMMICLVPLAKQKGMAHLFQQAKQPSTLVAYLIYIFLSMMGMFMWKQATVFPLLTMLIVTLLVFMFLRRKVVRLFGGITGDVVGASTEGMESCLWMIVWLYHYVVMG